MYEQIKPLPSSYAILLCESRSDRLQCTYSWALIIFYIHVLIASIDSLLLIELCLTLFEICYMYIVFVGLILFAVFSIDIIRH